MDCFAHRNLGGIFFSSPQGKTDFLKVSSDREANPRRLDALACHPETWHEERLRPSAAPGWGGSGGACPLTQRGPVLGHLWATAPDPELLRAEGRGAGLPRFSRLASWLGGPSGVRRRWRGSAQAGSRGSVPRMRRSPGRRTAFIPDLAWTLPACPEGCCLLLQVHALRLPPEKVCGTGSCRERLRVRRRARGQGRKRGSPEGRAGAGSRQRAPSHPSRGAAIPAGLSQPTSLVCPLRD